MDKKETEAKFDTCFYKDGPDICIQNSCCTNATEYKCYFCLHPKLLITDLKKKTCEKCKLYISEKDASEINKNYGNW